MERSSLTEMYKSITKILSVLLATVFLISMLTACVQTDDDIPDGGITGDNLQGSNVAETPDAGEQEILPDTPSLPLDSTETDITEDPHEEVTEGMEQTPDGEESIPPQDTGSVEEPSVSEPESGEPSMEDEPADSQLEEVKELPRDKFDLPLPEAPLSEELLSLCLAPTETVGYDYFDNAVFLGDSVTLGLRNYTTKKRKTDAMFLSNAGFIAVGSYGVYEALKTPSDTTIHALYGGVQTQPQDILASMGAETVFICLGLNDVGLFSMKEHLIHYATLILRIEMACPGIKIVILSTTPLTVEGERKHLYNQKIDVYNRAVIELAKEYNCYYADISSVLKDDEGYLADELSSDNYCHLEDEAYDKIIEYLLTHATPDAVSSSDSEIRDTVVEPAADVEGYEGEMGEW